jgi:MSHA biogenesis protein MshP
MKSLPRRAKGFALILALFLIVSLSAIGAYLLTVSNVQVESGVMDEQSARAYQAARGGLEWGAYQVLQAGNCWAGTATMPFPADLANFSASVTCMPFMPETEGGASVATFRITSTGCNDTACPWAAVPGAAVPGYVERQLQLTVAR